MTNKFATGFLKQAQASGLSPVESQVLLEKYANQMGSGMPPHGGGQPPQHPGGAKPPGHQPAGGQDAQVTVNGQPLPPELAHVVMQILQKLTSGGDHQAGGQPGGQQPGM